MNFQEYQTSKQALYKKFSGLVHRLLENALTDNGFKCQQIQSREKCPKKLKTKLEQKNLLTSEEIEIKVKDLAGCRVIFYFNNDIETFLASELIKNEFEIEPESYKLFNVTENPKSSNECYTAVSFVVKLKKERTSLREYSEYEGLRCELQITTLLNHAFSETNHDIGYKRPDAGGYGKRTVDLLDQQLKEVMVDHLIPAGYKLQKIHDDYLRFKEGKEYFDSGVENKIINSPDRNELFDSLEKYKDTVVPHYDDFVKEFSGIIKILNLSIGLSGKLSYKDIETFFGKLPGKAHTDILKISLEILNSIQYVNPVGVFQFQINLYEKSENKEDKKTILNMLEHLVEFNLISLRNYEFYQVVCSTVASWSDTLLKSYKEVVLIISKALLATEFNSFENDHKSTKIIPHTLKGSNEIKYIREKCISFLIRLYGLCDSVREKLGIVNYLNGASRLPRSTENSDMLMTIILGNSNQIVNYYSSILENESFDVLLCIEDDLFRVYRVSKSVESRYSSNEKIYQSALLLNQNLLSFKDKLNSNQKYTIYKTLVGYNSVFISEWERGDFNYNEKTSYRESEIEKLAHTVNDESKSTWHEIIIMCVNSSLNDGATYMYFTKFIEIIGQKKPELLYDFLIEKSPELQRLLPCFLNALFFGKLNSQVRQLILKWVSEGKYLQECAQLFMLRKDVLADEEIFISILNQAMLANNVNATTMLVIAFVSTYNKDQLQLVETLFMPALTYLTAMKNTDWVNFAAGNIKIKQIVENLSADQVDILLKNLNHARLIDYSVEAILLPVCNKFPEKIINLMQERLSNKSKLTPSFEPIPFDFSEIDKPLSKSLISLESLCAWYDGDYSKFLHYGARLISLIYTDYDALIDSKLINMLDENFGKNLPIVMAILSHYKGDLNIYDICKKIIVELPEEDDRLKKVRSIMLGEAGLISAEGTYGMTHYYEGKKKLVLPLVDNSNEKISSFAKETIRILDNSIAQANRRGKGDDEMGKII